MRQTMDRKVLDEKGMNGHNESGQLSGTIRTEDSSGHVQRTALQQLDTVTSSDPENPLNWPLWIKFMILIQCSLLAAMGGLNTASINPALVKLGKEFHVTTVHASYQTTVCIALNGVCPWLWIPLARKYGRRPVYLFTTLLGFGSALACAHTHSFGQLIVARVFNGLFPVAFALGATTVTDLFPYHQRGRAMGFFTITMTTGSHLAPIIGGLIGQYLGWRWIFKFVSIVDAVLFVTSLFFLPETMYIPPDSQLINKDHIIEAEADTGFIETVPASLNSSQFIKDIYIKRLGLLATHRHRAPPLSTLAFFVATTKIIWYPSIILPALYYGTQYGFASILPAVTVAAIFTEAYKWSTLTIGLTYGAASTIGGILGECVSGWVVDLLLTRAQRRRILAGKAGKVDPEVRLRAIWPGEFIVPSALLIYGFIMTNHAHVSWFAPIFGIGLACFGLQIITTTCYTYSIDCYRDRAGEVAQVFNFVRQMIGMTFAFYAVNLGKQIGWWALFLMYALLGSVAAFIGILLIMWRGKRWRERIAVWEGHSE